MMGVVFALSGTLGTGDGLYVAALRQLLSELTEERSIRQNGRVVEELADRLGPTLEQFPSGLGEIAALLDHDTMSAPTLTARYRTIASQLVPGHFKIFDDVAPTLTELGQLGVPLAVLAEGWAGIDHAKAALSGFNGAVISADDVANHNPRSISAFATVAATLRQPADRLWFIGAEPRRDVAPARAAGFQTVWLNRNGATYPSGVAQPDHIIFRLDEFLGLISEPYMKSALTLREILGATLQFRMGHVIPANPMRED